MSRNSQEHSYRNNASPLAAGTMLGRYRIVRFIQSGGMGEVYEADDTGLARKVAIKLLPSLASATGEARAQFEREAKAAASLSHTNVITVHDVGEYQQRPFFAMEYVEGEPLADRIARGPLPSEEVVDITLQMCRGLAAAHKSGLAHRDLKPSNLLIDNDGRVKILDFGLASMRDVRGSTADDPRSGTVAYMSPEQLNGEEVTAQSDLFSLGIVMYEMLTGRRPFQGDYEASLVYSIVNDTPEPLRNHHPDISEHLEAVVLRLLEKDRSARYQRVEEVLADLGGKTPSLPGGAGYFARNRWRVVSWLAVLALVVAVVAWLFPTSERESVGPGKPMLAVLPFDNLGQADDEYFADGVVDAITTHLARIGGLGVISRSSAMEYRHTDKAVRQIAAELGCQLLVTGAVYWDRHVSPSRVQVHARLVDAASNTHLWADSYDGVLDDIFSVQSEIARDVASELQLVLRESDRQALLAHPTDNLEAYDLYLRGNQYFNRSWDRGDIEIAIGMYQRAVELDSEFALAWAMLSRGHESMYWEPYYDHTEARKEQARAAAERARTLAPDLLEGHLALGYYYYHCDYDYRKALHEFEQALRRWPNNAELYSAIAAVQRRTGAMKEAAANFARAAELDPRSNLKLFDAGLTYSLLRQYEPAAVYLDRTIALSPDWPLAHVYRAWLEIFHNGDTAKARQILAAGSRQADLAGSNYYWWLARVIEPDPQTVLDVMKIGADTVLYCLQKAQMNRLLGRHDVELACADSARVRLEPLARQYPDNARFQSHLGLAYAGLRQRDQAFVHGERALELLPTTRDAFDALFFTLDFAEICVIFGEYDRAIEQLHYLLTIPGFVSSAYLKLDPLWRPLHDHPRWPELVGDTSTVQ